MNHILPSTDDDDGGVLAQLVTHITTRYLSQLYAICVIWTAASTATTTSTIASTFNAVLQSSNSPSLPAANVSEWSNFWLLTTHPERTAADDGDDLLAAALAAAMNDGCQAFIMSTDVALRVLTAYAAAVSLAVNRYPQKHFVFVPAHGRTDDAGVVDVILAHPAIANLPNVLVISTSRNDTVNTDVSSVATGYDLFTAHFGGRSPAHAAQPLWLDAFEQRRMRPEFRLGVHLFPDKLQRLNGRPLRLALFNYKPYTVWQETPPGEGNANVLGAAAGAQRTIAIDGTESLMLVVFCQLHDCTLEISLDEANEWGEAFANGTGVGVLGALAEGRAEVGVSALYLWSHEFTYLDFSTPMSRTGITCIVPKPKLLSGLYLPTMPFSSELWLGVLVSAIVGTVALIFVECFLLQRRRGRGEVAVTAADRVKPGEIAFQMCAMYLFQASNMMSRPGAEKFILTCVLIIGLMIGNAYSGGLASIMTVPQYEEPIDTAHQMATHGLLWGATQDAWIFSILLATEPDIVKLVSQFRPSTVEDLRRHAQAGDFGFSLERLPYGSYAIGEYIDETAMDNLQLMRTDIYYEYALAMTSKTWPLKDALDAMILRVVQSGIQSVWEWRVTAAHSDNAVQRRVRSSHSAMQSHQPQALSVSRVWGAFVIWLIGMATATLGFVVELAASAIAAAAGCGGKR